MATIVCHLLLVHNHVVEIIHILIGKDFRVGLLLITYLVVEYVSFGIYLPISEREPLTASTQNHSPTHFPMSRWLDVLSFL